VLFRLGACEARYADERACEAHYANGMRWRSAIRLDKDKITQSIIKRKEPEGWRLPALYKADG